MALDSYYYGTDPADILERKQEREARQSKQSPQRRRLERLFEGEDDMGRKLEIPGHVSAAMYQWGGWADRPNYWANLRITPFCKLLGISAGRAAPEIKLDPQSQAVHRAYLGLRCEKTKAVLCAYYVLNLAWDDRQDLFRKIGVGRDTFYRLLKQGSQMVYNGSGIATKD